MKETVYPAGERRGEHLAGGGRREASHWCAGSDDSCAQIFGGRERNRGHTHVGRREVWRVLRAGVRLRLEMRAPHVRMLPVAAGARRVPLLPRCPRPAARAAEGGACVAHHGRRHRRSDGGGGTAPGAAVEPVHEAARLLPAGLPASHASGPETGRREAAPPEPVAPSEPASTRRAAATTAAAAAAEATTTRWERRRFIGGRRRGRG